MRPSFSLGIEEEYQTIDPVTRDLRSHIRDRDAGAWASCGCRSA